MSVPSSAVRSPGLLSRHASLPPRGSSSPLVNLEQGIFLPDGRVQLVARCQEIPDRIEKGESVQPAFRGREERSSVAASASLSSE